MANMDRKRQFILRTRTSGKSAQQTSMLITANVRFPPFVTDAALQLDGGFGLACSAALTANVVVALP